MEELNQAYRLGLARVGRDVMIWPGAKIVAPRAISIGDSVIIDDFTFIAGGAKTEIGSFVHVASFVSILGGGEFHLGDFAGVSSGCRVYTGNDDYLGGSLTGPTVPAAYREVVRSFVRIGRHAIVGANSVVLPGVTIGEGATVGALSLVSHDLEPWTVFGGVPARPLKARRRDKITELEARLRAEVYDADGNYIPKADRR